MDNTDQTADWVTLRRVAEADARIYSRLAREHAAAGDHDAKLRFEARAGAVRSLITVMNILDAPVAVPA